MRPSIRLLYSVPSMSPTTRTSHFYQITLFTRANCQLCTNAKSTLSHVWDKRRFTYTEIDVMQPEGKQWRDLYEFDTPVIHIARSIDGDELPGLAAQAKKLMHRFKEEDVMAKMDEVDMESRS